MKIDIWSQFKAAGLPPPEPEYLFAKEELGRNWRFDFAWEEHRIALELDGGNWKRGRHARPQGIEDDHEKRNAGQVLGWKVFVVTTGMAEDGRLMLLLEQIRELMETAQ